MTLLMLCGSSEVAVCNILMAFKRLQEEGVDFQEETWRVRVNTDIGIVNRAVEERDENLKLMEGRESRFPLEHLN